MKDRPGTLPSGNQPVPSLPENRLPRHPEVLNNPVRILAVIVVSIFTAEALVMLILPMMPALSSSQEALLDAFLLLILISPALYFFIFRPARAQMTERKRSEETLRVSEEKYRSLVESTDDSIYLLDRNCRYLYMNKKHMSRMGFRGDEYVGRPYSAFHSFEATRVFTEQIGKVFETDEPAQYEHRSQRDEKYFLRTLSPVNGDGGKTIAVNVVSKDITGMKQMEAEKEKLIDGLREALANINTLKGLIPICAWCKKVRDDKGYWNEIETYLKEHSEADFTHGICPECLKGLEDKEEREAGEKDLSNS